MKNIDITIEDLMKNGMLLQDIPEEQRTPEKCLAAVHQNGFSVKYVPVGKRTPEICLAAVRQSGWALEYLPSSINPSEIFLAAVQQDWRALEYVPIDMRTYELCLEAVSQDGCALEHVPADMRTQEFYVAAARMMSMQHYNTHNKIMKINIKKIVKEAVIPSYAKEGDAGLDLVATTRLYDEDNNCISYGTGIAIEIPKGFVGLIFPRSSIFKKSLILSNSVGVIDSGYRGELIVKYKEKECITGKFKSNNGQNSRYYPLHYNVGDKIAQLIIIPYPTIEFIEKEELSTSERDGSGFGSTD